MNARTLTLAACLLAAPAAWAEGERPCTDCQLVVVDAADGLVRLELDLGARQLERYGDFELEIVDLRTDEVYAYPLAVGYLEGRSSWLELELHLGKDGPDMRAARWYEASLVSRFHPGAGRPAKVVSPLDLSW